MVTAITVRLPDPTYEWLRKEAFDQRTSINALITGSINHFMLKDDER